MITLQDIFRIDNPAGYKLHLACRNEEWVNPLDVYVANPNDWHGWNAWRGSKNDWTRDLIFSLMDFYHRPNSWLFGGVFRVLERHPDHYVLEELAEYEKYVGRVILSFYRYQGMRGRAFRLENFIQDFQVSDVLPRPYEGETFPGFENICHDFSLLESIFKSERSDWRAALSSVKGIYLIADRKTGRQYIGSAYGGMGIWARWACYIGAGHGWNDELTRLIKKEGFAYAREHFRFSIIEVMTFATPDDAVISRESYWKETHLTRQHGYNKN